MFTRIIIICFLAFTLIGCGADYGRVKVNEHEVEIEAGQGHDHDSNYNHCPPGHRKKGWCD